MVSVEVAVRALIGCSPGISCFLLDLAPESPLLFAPSLIPFGPFFFKGFPVAVWTAYLGLLLCLLLHPLPVFMFWAAWLYPETSSLSGSRRSWSSCLGFLAGWILPTGRICCFSECHFHCLSVVRDFGLLPDFGLSGFWSVFLWSAGSFVFVLSPSGCFGCAAVE